MDLNSIAGMVRIPVADPGSRKEGLLSLSLPRECFEGNCVPQFYGSDTVETGPVSRSEPAAAPEAVPQPADDRSDSHLPVLDGVIRDLQAVRLGVTSAQQSLQQTTFATTRCDNDLQRMQLPLSQAERDTTQTDSSGAGRELEFLVSGFRNDMQSSEQAASRTTSDSSRASDRLSGVKHELQALAEELGKDGEKYGSVLSSLGRAGSLVDAIDRGVYEAVGGTRDGSRSLESSDRQMVFGETYARQIAFDGLGRDVSMPARQLHQAVDQAAWNLQDAERHFTDGRWPLDQAQRNIDQAVGILQEARRALEQIQG